MCPIALQIRGSYNPLSALLFVAGVMNLLWVASIAAFVLIEKLVPRGELVGRVAGGVLSLAGILLMGQGLVM